MMSADGPHEQQPQSGSLGVAQGSAAGKRRELYQIADHTGRPIYQNLQKSGDGYDWGDGYGHISAYMLKVENWTVIPQPAEPNEKLRDAGESGVEQH